VRITGESVGKNEIRCQQAGDWTYTKHHIEVKSVRLSDWRYELLVQVHELVEAALCKHRGITDETVTEFDAQFEKERAEGMHTPTEEDGDDARAPYACEHAFASGIERLLAVELGVNWKSYEKEVESLFA